MKYLLIAILLCTSFGDKTKREYLASEDANTQFCHFTEYLFTESGCETVGELYKYGGAGTGFIFNFYEIGSCYWTEAVDNGSHAFNRGSHVNAYYRFKILYTFGSGFDFDIYSGVYEISYYESDCSSR